MLHSGRVSHLRRRDDCHGHTSADQFAADQAGFGGLQPGLRVLLLPRSRGRSLQGAARPPHDLETLERLVDTYLFYSYPEQRVRLSGRRADAGRAAVLRKAGGVPAAVRPRRPVGQQRAADQRHAASTRTGATCSASTTGCWAFRWTVPKKSTIATASTRKAAARGSA